MRRLCLSLLFPVLLIVLGVMWLGEHLGSKAI